VQGAPNGERWEIYTVLQDSATFWGQDGSRSWDAAEAVLGSGLASPAQTVQCCGTGDQAVERTEHTTPAGAIQPFGWIALRRKT
jgi:hypothetical protein